MIGHNVRYLRQKRGWTLAQLGEKTGFTRQYICDIEHGRRTPWEPTIEKLARALRTTPQYIRYGK